MNPVLEQALISLAMWRLQFPYITAELCLPLRATGTPEERGNGKVWPLYYNCTSATSNWSEEFLTLQINVGSITEILGKRFICSYHAWQMRLCSGKTGDLKSKRTIFCLIPSSWPQYLRYLRFERPLLNLNFSCCLSSAQICSVRCLFQVFSPKLVFVPHSSILRHIQKVKNIFLVYMGHGKWGTFKCQDSVMGLQCMPMLQQLRNTWPL